MNRLMFSLTCYAALLGIGCAAHKPHNFRFSGCRVEKSWTDAEGRERKECLCLGAKQVGLDAKTGASVWKCQ